MAESEWLGTLAGLLPVEGTPSFPARSWPRSGWRWALRGAQQCVWWAEWHRRTDLLAVSLGGGGGQRTLFYADVAVCAGGILWGWTRWWQLSVRKRSAPDESIADDARAAV